MAKEYKDSNEVLEDMIEDWAFANIKDGKFKCPGCNEWKNLDQSDPFVKPYSLPTCLNCNHPILEE